MQRNPFLFISGLLVSVAGCAQYNVISPASHATKIISEHIGELDGIWVSDGYGYAIKQSGDDFAFYHVTPDICVSADVADTTLAEVFDLFRLDQNQQTLFLSTSTERYEFVFHRAQMLPAPCETPPPASRAATIDAVISFMQTHYAFFEARGVDWTTASHRLEKVKDTVLSDQQLYDILKRELAPLKDAHVELTAYFDDSTFKFDADPGVIRDTLTNLAEADKSTFREKRAEFNSELWVTGVGENILRGQGQSAGNDRIRFGMTTESVGYLVIKSMGGFIEESPQPLTEAETFEAALDAAIGLFNDKNAQSVIIDLSLNSGGYDYISRLLAERFTSKPVPAYSFYPGDAQEKYEFKYTLLPSLRPRYEREVYVLTSRASVSAAELAAMCFDAIETAQIAGEPTRGALSTKLAKLLPNGWELMLSNQVYLDHRGQIIEAVGVIPDIAIDVFADEGLAEGHIAAVRRLVRYIESQASK